MSFAGRRAAARRAQEQISSSIFTSLLEDLEMRDDGEMHEAETDQDPNVAYNQIDNLAEPESEDELPRKSNFCKKSPQTALSSSHANGRPSGPSPMPDTVTPARRGRGRPPKSAAAAPAPTPPLSTPVAPAVYTSSNLLPEPTLQVLEKIAVGVDTYSQAQLGRPLTHEEQVAVAQHVETMLLGVHKAVGRPVDIQVFGDNILPPTNKDGYLAWARKIMAEKGLYDEEHLPALLSYIWQPYAKPPSSWAREWLPASIIEDKLPHWELQLMFVMGATLEDLATRCSRAHEKTANYTLERERCRTRLRRRVDAWRRTKGGFVFQNPKKGEEGARINKAILTGVFPNYDNNGKDVKFRDAFTPIQLLFNCSWEIDIDNGVMLQPGLPSNANPMAPHGGRNHYRLFKLAAMPRWVRNLLSAHNVAEPDIHALRIEHPALLQDRLCFPDQNVVDPTITTTSSTSSSTKRSSATKVNDTPAKRMRTIPGTQDLAGLQAQNLLSSATSVPESDTRMPSDLLGYGILPQTSHVGPDDHSLPAMYDSLEMAAPGPRFPHDGDLMTPEQSTYQYQAHLHQHAHAIQSNSTNPWSSNIPPGMHANLQNGVNGNARAYAAFPTGVQQAQYAAGQMYNAPTANVYGGGRNGEGPLGAYEHGDVNMASIPIDPKILENRE